jgi:predicted RNA-binding protein with PUA-like domain
MKYWLMKSEPDVFSIDDLKKQKETSWDGVRNYQARNFMKDQMQVGDQVLFYHSNAEPPGVAGVAEVSHEASPDLSQFDKKSEYFEPKASKEKPMWFCVKVRFKERFKDVIPLEELRQQKALSKMPLLARGQRLSVQPVSKEEFDYVCKMAK